MTASRLEKMPTDGYSLLCADSVKRHGWEEGGTTAYDTAAAWKRIFDQDEPCGPHIVVGPGHHGAIRTDVRPFDGEPPKTPTDAPIPHARAEGRFGTVNPAAKAAVERSRGRGA